MRDGNEVDGVSVTFASLLQRLTSAEFNCELHSTSPTSPDGHSLPVRYLLRVVDDGSPANILIAPLPDASPTEEEVRDILEQLRIDPGILGVGGGDVG